MVLNYKLFKLHIWYINQLTYQNNWSTNIPERCFFFFSYLVVYSNIFLLLLMGPKGVLKRSFVAIASPTIFFRMSFCKLYCDEVSWSSVGNTSNFLLWTFLYKNCMQLLICFQAHFLIFSMRWIVSLGLSLEVFVQWVSSLFHLTISFKNIDS